MITQLGDVPIGSRFQRDGCDCVYKRIEPRENIWYGSCSVEPVNVCSWHDRALVRPATRDPQSLNWNLEYYVLYDPFIDALTSSFQE
jgi:hypothetical protein